MSSRSFVLKRNVSLINYAMAAITAYLEVITVVCIQNFHVWGHGTWYIWLLKLCECFQIIRRKFVLRLTVIYLRITFTYLHGNYFFLNMMIKVGLTYEQVLKTWVSTIFYLFISNKSLRFANKTFWGRKFLQSAEDVSITSWWEDMIF